MSATRVLFLSANPSSTPRLALDEEMHAIQQRLRQSGSADRFELRSEWALRADELPAALMRHRPHIVHFSGHGSSVGQLMLVGERAGEAVPVEADTLRRLFKILSRDIFCVVLNACFSDEQARALAEILPCAVGMARAVKDNAAIAFAAGFYEALAFGESLQTAFDLGCTATELRGHVNQREVPQLRARRGVEPDKLFLLSQAAPGTAGGVAVADSTVMLTRDGLRKLLSQVLRTSSDFKAFCLDYFPDVYHRFGSGMNRLDQESILLEVHEPADVLARLRRHAPDAVAHHLSSLPKG